MKTRYYKDEDGLVRGLLTVSSRYENEIELEFDPTTLPTWYPCGFTYDLMYNVTAKKVYLTNTETHKGAIPYGEHTYTSFKNSPKLNNWVIKELVEGNDGLSVSSVMMKSTWWRKPGDYTSEDVQDDLKEVTSKMDVVLSRFYTKNHLADTLPKFYNFEGVAFLYNLIKNPKADPKHMPMEPNRYTEDFTNLELSEEDRVSLDGMQAIYIMLQECRKIAKAYEA